MLELLESFIISGQSLIVSPYILFILMLRVKKKDRLACSPSISYFLNVLLRIVTKEHQLIERLQKHLHLKGSSSRLLGNKADRPSCYSLFHRQLTDTDEGKIFCIYLCQCKKNTQSEYFLSKILNYQPTSLGISQLTLSRHKYFGTQTCISNEGLCLR